MMTSNSETITAEGATLAEATKKAASALGVPVEHVKYEYDREHLAGGAATVRIRASRRDPTPEGAKDKYPHQRTSHDDRRDEVIRERGRKAVRDVLDGREQSVVVDLNSYERHLVHTVVRETAGISSHSVGEGPRKDVVVTRAVDEAT